MSDKITQQDVIDSSVPKSIKELNTDLAKSVKLMISATREALAFKNALNPQNIQQVITAQKQSNTISEKSTKANKKRTQSLTALGKERIRVENQKKKILAQTLALEEKGTKTLIKGQERLKIARKKARTEAQKALGVSKKSNGMFKSMAKGLLSVAATTLSVRAVFTLFKNSLKTIAGFEEAMSKVRAVTGAMPEDFKALQTNAKTLGSTTSKTAKEVAGLQLEFAKLGFSTQEILDATDATISLSIAAGSDLAESAKVAASTIRGFGLNAAETQNVVDVMAKSFSSSALDLSKFQVAMGNVAPVAKSFGKDVEFTTARLSILSDAGLDASKSGTSLRNMFLELSKRGLTWDEGLAKINSSTNKNVTALNLFGKRGSTAALILAENIDKADKLEESYRNSAGAAEEMARIMEDNLIGDTKKLSSAWEGFILGLNKGDGEISKTFRNITQGLTRILTKIKELNSTPLEIGGTRAEQSFKSTKDYILRQSEDLQKQRLAQEIDHERTMVARIDNEKAALQDKFLYSKKKLKDLEKAQAEHNKTLQLLIDFEKNIDSINEDRTSNQVINEEDVTEDTKDELDERIENQEDYLSELRKNLKAHNSKIEEINTDQIEKDWNKALSEREKEKEFEQETYDELAEIRKAEIDKEIQDRKNADEAKKQSTADWINYAINEAQNLSNSILGYLDTQVTSQEEADIAKAESAGATDAEIEKIEEAAAQKRKDIAIADAAIYTALAIVKALFTSDTWLEGIIAGVLIAAEGAVQIAAIEASSFEKGTNDSGDNWLDATVSEKGREKVILKDGSSFYTPDKQSKMLLPPHSEIIPNHQLQNEFAEIQAYGSKGKQIEIDRKQEELTRELIKTVKNKKETTLNITENGIGVTAKKGNDFYKYLARKYKN